jgi:GST-like protein
MIDLFYYTGPNSRKVLMALEELELPYRINWVDITSGEQFADEYIRVNPNSKVPAIVDPEGPGGGPVSLFESGAILLYLAEKTGRLMPADPERRWDAVCWLFWQAANQGPMLGQAAHFVSHAARQGIHDAYSVGRYTTETRRLYAVMEARLQRADHLAGELSMADICCFPWVRVARGQGIDIKEYPAVEAWAERISARPSARVKVADPREARALDHTYTREQFEILFRSGPPPGREERS